MKKEIKNFLEKISNLNDNLNCTQNINYSLGISTTPNQNVYLSNPIITEIKEIAKCLLQEDLKEETLNFISEYLNKYHWNIEKRKQAIRDKNKIEIIYFCRDYESEKQFINEHFKELDKILNLMNEYLDQLEEEDKGEENRNEK